MHADHAEDPADSSVMSFRRTLERGLEAWNLDPGSRFLRQCEGYFRILREWNRVFRLVGHRNARDMAVNLFLDSLSLAFLLPEKGRLLDMGSGAGFPGLVLKLFRPNLHCFLLESARKKANFLRQVILELELEGIQVVQARLGLETVKEPALESVDVVTAKALGPMKHLWSLGAPFLNSCGRLIAMKGPRGEEEAFSEMDAHVTRVGYELPEGFGPRTLLIVTRCVSA